MTLATTDDLRIASASAFQPVLFSKTGATNTAVDQLFSYFKSGGTPVNGATPTTAAICNRTLTGVLNFTNAPTGTYRLAYLSAYTTADASTFYIFDRLAHMGGLFGTTTTSQTVGLSVTDGSLTARIGASDYSNVEWYIECYISTGGTPATATVTYTNAAGTGGRTTNVTIPATMRGQRMIRIIGSNDEKIQSIQSIIHTSTGTAGNYGVTAVRCIDCFPIVSAKHTYEYSWFENALIKVHDDSALFLGAISQISTSGSVAGGMMLVAA